MYLTHVDLGVQRRKNGGMDWKAIGRRARRLRQDKGWTQAQLGKRAGGVSANTIRGFEKGTLNTRWPKIKDIVRALGTTIERVIASLQFRRAWYPMLLTLDYFRAVPPWYRPFCRGRRRAPAMAVSISDRVRRCWVFRTEEGWWLHGRFS